MTLLASLPEVLSAVVPVQCAGCGQWDTTLCPVCLGTLERGLQEVSRADGAGLLPVWALGTYQGPLRSMLVSWKNGKREDLAPTFAEAARRAGRLWAEQLSPAEHGTIDNSGSLLVLPAPSGWQRRLRGQMVTPILADGVAAGVAEALRARTNASGSSAPFILSADILRRPLASGPAHQSGRSAQGRRSARAQPPQVRAQVRGLSILLVDDVVTTGSTLGSCVRALDAAGAHTIAALAIAAAPAPPSRSDTAHPCSSHPRNW